MFALVNTQDLNICIVIVYNFRFDMTKHRRLNFNLLQQNILEIKGGSLSL